MNAFPLRLLPVVALLVALPATGDGRDDERHRRLPESVQRVERETGGTVLSARPIRRGDREIYRMKVLTPEGRVRVVQDDPRRHREPPSPPVAAQNPRPQRDESPQ